VTPGDPRHELETQLRATLREGQRPSPLAADDLLPSVHRRAARRRARRRAASATVVVAALVGVAAVALQWPLRHTTVTVAESPEAVTSGVPPSVTATEPTSTPTQAATSSAPTQRTSTPPTVESLPVEPGSFAVESVTAVKRNAFWVLGTGTCPEGACNVIAHTTDAGATFTYRIGPEPAETASPTTPSDLHSTVAGLDLRYAVTGDDAWGFGEEVWATHDAGHTWAPVTFPVPAVVTSVQAWDETVWAFGTSVADGSPLVMSSPVSQDLWVPVDVGLATTDTLTAPVVADGVVAAFVTHADGGLEYVRSRDGGATWEVVPPPDTCQTPLASSGVEGAVWVHCSAATGEASLAVSTDGGDTWAQHLLPAPTSGLTTMTGIDHRQALFTDGASVSIVTVQSDAVAVGQVVGPYADADDVWDDDVGYTYAGFTDPLTGYLITSGGELARTEDGGWTWTSVQLP